MRVLIACTHYSLYQSKTEFEPKHLVINGFCQTHLYNDKPKGYKSIHKIMCVAIGYRVKSEQQI